jgi:integrase/recombinase XerD
VKGRLPTLVPRDERERQVVHAWREAGLGNGTIAVYLCSVRQFRAYCHKEGTDEIGRLTRADVMAYARSYVGSRRGRRVKEWSRHTARNALHAWSCALQTLGVRVPPWPSVSAPRRWPALVDAYGEYRRSHRGVAAATLERDMKLASDFLEALRSRSRSIAAMQITDIDSFVERLLVRLSRRTVAGLCSSLRSFLRFLRATGRVQRDLAPLVVGPRFRHDERPPRALPWKSIRQILRVIPRLDRVGQRDYAMFLLMAAYGLGGGEVVGLRLADVDWRAGVLRARRPKTAVPIELPLLPAVARALAAYLRRGRPRTTPARALFVTVGLPHRSLTTSVLRHQARKYAARAGIVVGTLGAHVFRHSYATRQIDAGAPAKIVGDILGHRRPSSISVYVRLALRRLRTVGLPVPR